MTVQELRVGDYIQLGTVKVRVLTRPNTDKNGSVLVTVNDPIVPVWCISWKTLNAGKKFRSDLSVFRKGRLLHPVIKSKTGK